MATLTNDQKIMIERMIKSGMTPNVIAAVLDLRIEDVHFYLQSTKIGKLTRKSPSSLSTSYLINRLQKGYTARDIAKETGCGVSSIYKLFKDRGINVLAYSKVENEGLVGVQLVDTQGGGNDE